MLNNERASYEVSDYLQCLNPSQYGDFPVDRRARGAIVDWIVKVVKMCDYSLETAEIATSILDRFAALDESKDVLIHRPSFQLASLTAIYTAVKVHEHEAISSAFVAKLSGGVHTKRDIEKMELRMLQALEWRVNPPTVDLFVSSFLHLVPANAFNSLERRWLMKLVRCQVTFSLLGCDFFTFRSSDVALASLLNAMVAVIGDQYNALQLEASVHSRTSIKVTHALDQLRESLREANYHAAVSKVLKEQESQGIDVSRPRYGEKRTGSSTHAHSPKCVTKRL